MGSLLGGSLPRDHGSRPENKCWCSRGRTNQGRKMKLRLNLRAAPAFDALQAIEFVQLLSFATISTTRTAAIRSLAGVIRGYQTRSNSRGSAKGKYQKGLGQGCVRRE